MSNPIAAKPLNKRLLAFARQALEVLETSEDPAEEFSELARALHLGKLRKGKFKRIKELSDE